MYRRHKPADLTAKPEKIISIEGRVVTGAANESTPSSGKLNYLGKKAPPQAHKRVERVEVGKGQYMGYEGHITAFVWLDDVPDAVNDAE